MCAADPLEDLRELMAGARVRLEFAPAFTARGMVPTVQPYRLTMDAAREKWVKAGPLIVPQEGGTRADLLEMLAQVTRDGAV